MSQESGRPRRPLPPREATTRWWRLNPLGAGLGGLVAQAFGIPAVFWAAGVVLALVGAVTLPALTNGRLADGAVPAGQ